MKYFVVGGEQERPGVAAQGVGEHADGAQIQVAGRLVEQQQVGRLQQQAHQRHPAALAAAEHGQRLEHLVAAEQERAEEIAHPRHHVGGRHRLHVLQDAAGAGELLGAILRVVADGHPGAERHLPVRDRRGAGKSAHQRRLADPVFAHQREPVAAVQLQVQVADHLVVAVGQAQTGGAERAPSALGRGREAEPDVRLHRRRLQEHHAVRAA